MAKSRLRSKHRHVWGASCWPFVRPFFARWEHNGYTTQRCEMLICKPFSPAVTGVCNRNKGAEKVWKGHLELQSSSRWGEIHLLLELLKCIHTTSENNSFYFFYQLLSDSAFITAVQIFSISCPKRENYKQQTTQWIPIQHEVSILQVNVPTYQTINLKTAACFHVHAH